MPKKLPAIPALKDLKFRKTRSIPELLKRVRQSFEKIKDYRKGKSNDSLPDVLMSGLAIFGLKYPSLLAFDNDKDTPRLRHNLQHLYGVKDKAPSDSRLREILDDVPPDVFRETTVSVIQEVQRQGVLETFRYLEGYLVSSDGTGLFSSTKICCPECCENIIKMEKLNIIINFLHLLLCILIKRQCFPCSMKPSKKKMARPKMIANAMPQNDCYLH